MALSPTCRPRAVALPFAVTLLLSLPVGLQAQRPPAHLSAQAVGATLRPGPAQGRSPTHRRERLHIDRDTTAEARERRMSAFGIAGAVLGAVVGGTLAARRTTPVDDSFFGTEYVGPVFSGAVLGTVAGGLAGLGIARRTRR